MGPSGRLSGFRDRTAGQALVEFALVLPVTLLILIGLLDSARAVWYSNTLALAAREGTRYAIVNGDGSSDPADAADIAAVVRSYAVGVAGLSVTTTWPDTTKRRGDRVSVEVTVPFKPVLSEVLLGGGLTVTLRGASQLFIHQ